jgi:hypothetical protein
MDWAAATLDGWVEELNCPLEAKAVEGREPIEVVIDRYTPQLHWQCYVTGAKKALISITAGLREPIVEEVSCNETYLGELVIRAELFMRHVKNGTAPNALTAMPPPPQAVKIIDMTGVKVWQRQAEQWIQVEGAARSAKDCEAVLKALVAPDVAKAFGHGVRVTRDRAGRLSLRRDQ